MCKDLKCKYCGGNRINRYGKQGDNQRYLCRDCKKVFIVNKDKRKKYSEEFKMEVIKWYLENVGIRSIERRMGVADTTILRWIKNFGKIIKERIIKEVNNIPEDLKELKEKKDIEILEGDEIVTYIKKNLKMEDKTSGYGYLLTETGIKLLIFK